MDEKTERSGKKPEAQKPDDPAWLEAKERAEAQAAEENRRIENLYAHAGREHGFSAYESSAITSKQALKDLCQEYELYCASDPMLKDLVGRVEKYAELDAPGGDAYHEEVAFIKSLPAVFDRLEERFRQEETEIQADIRKAFPDGAPAELTEEQKQQDRLLTAREAALENKQRIVASLGVYFDTLTMGGMQDSPMDRAPDREADELMLREALNSSYQTALLGKDGSIEFLNTAGQELDTAIRGDVVPGVVKAIANPFRRDVERRDAPLFPHEPRMNDVKQLGAGECYLYAGLQDVARLYPEKLKEAVKDNGDGTATVRFFKRDKKPDGSKTYQPFFVRVDKRMAKIAAWERGGQECMWVNAIERAYAMSGIHLTQGQDSVRPVSTQQMNGVYQAISQKGAPVTEALYQQFPWIVEKTPVKGAGENEPQYTYRAKEWKPSVASIEGGKTAQFLETLLGGDFAAHDIVIPAERVHGDTVQEERAYQRWEEKAEIAMPAKDDMSQRIRFAMSEHIPDKELAQFMTAPEDEMLWMAYQYDPQNALVSEEEYIPALREAIRLTEEVLAEKVERSGGSLRVTDRLDLADDVKVRLPEMGHFCKVAMETMVGTIDVNLKYAQRTSASGFFNEVVDKLEKGFPVSAGSRSEKKGEKMPIADTHAYSVLGAFKTEDEPPRYFFRMRNPWGDHHVAGWLGNLLVGNNNGVQYQTGANGEAKAKWVHQAEGVFDIELKDFLKYFDGMKYNGSENLERTPHIRTEGYDIITPAQAQRQADRTVTDDAFTNYARAANDIYAALLRTDSSRSKDSPQYKALKESAQAFRDSVSTSRGKDMDVLKQAAADLQKKAQAYLDHVPNSPSNRQKMRMNVCRTVMAVVLAAQGGSKEPAKEIEAQFARKLMEANFRAQKRQVPPEQLDELAEKLTENRAFRSAAGKMNLNQMLNAAESTVKAALKDLSAAAKGKGVDTGLDLNTLKTKDYAVKI